MRKGAAFLLGLVAFGAVFAVLFHYALISKSDTDLSRLFGGQSIEAAPAESPDPNPELFKDRVVDPFANCEDVTLRDRFAFTALLSPDAPSPEAAYEIADAMLSAREQSPQTAPQGK